MMNAIQNQAATFDIEQNINHQSHSSGCKTAMVTACAAISAGLTSVGSLFLAGAIGRTGPFAVPHDYGTVCSYSRITGQSLGCGQEDHSNSKAITYGFIGVVLAGLGAATAIGTYRMIKPTRQNP